MKVIIRELTFLQKKWYENLLESIWTKILSLLETILHDKREKTSFPSPIIVIYINDV